jgi:caffeoyl-CoA O-methyltransferase
MERKLEKYIIDHSTQEDPVLEELYRQTYVRFVNPNMISGHLQGKLLEMVSRMIRPSYILEIGTFVGYSAICLARGLKPGGKLITIEINDELKEFATSFFVRAGVDSLITIMNGRMQDVIRDINQEFDLVFIDGDKREYIEYYNLIIGKVKHGGYILVDNVLWGGAVIEKYVKDNQAKGIIEFNEMIASQKNIEKLILPLRDGLMLIRKL